MPYRDERGHFISREEAERRGLVGRETTPAPTPADTPEPDEPDEGVWTPPPRWAEQAAHPQGSVFIETGRGQTAEVQVGAPFQETIERVAEDAHYGGFFRVYLNGEEIVRPNEAPATIEAGQRITLTSYDKVG